jgi:uncharacterized protein
LGTKTNPFVFGAVVSGKDFADRRVELRELLSDLEGGQNVLLFSPRRYGKTSLILEVLEKLDEKHFLKVYVDLFPLTSKSEFAEAYAGSIARAARKRGPSGFEEVVRMISEHIPGVKLVLKPGGTPLELDVEITRTRKDIDFVLESLFDLPLKVGKKDNKKMIVVFDEFQEIVNLDGKWLERVLRTKIQHHGGKVTYVFTGSRRHLLDEIFANKNRALYRVGKSFNLGKILPEEFASFIAERFRSTGMEIDDATVAKILEISESHPYYTQQLCHELWNISHDSGKIRDSDIDGAIKQVISNQNYAYSSLWDSLRKTQRSMLAALAVSRNDRRIYSKDFLDAHDLASASSVQRAISALEEKGIVDRQNGGVVISDVFLKRWLLQQTNGPVSP